MKVLVTGASGTLGPFVIRALMERHDLVLMSRQPPDPAFVALPWVQGDVRYLKIVGRLSMVLTPFNTWPRNPGRWTIPGCGGRRQPRSPL